ncbi:hypothetical protein [Hymenobacter crusticola]|uniref:Uncharacterized protein n=1 Tax=Hymenobacter crusticola TaxID=1770526 RepID=A0A243WEG3_9BACT|nr:hypothetical protein [Hymenobacter crusticola]OUJ74124.1 hypothetical protein BXP70_10300 [Hymenobacter crusticola]
MKHQFEFVQDNQGLHQLGGDIPFNFKIPENEFLGGFQYLGFINNMDIAFNWLLFPLHLICPIFTDFEYLFLDYENPMAPRLIHPLNTAEISTAYNELTKDSYIIYNEKNFSLKSFKGINGDNEFEVVAIAGKPSWTQSSKAPTCPKSQKKMKFVCQLMSNGPLKAKEKNVTGHNDYYEELFTNLNFWCDGDLKVFFEPTSKVACYFIQNT